MRAAVTLAPMLLLAGCGRGGDAPQERAAHAVATPGFECAVDGASEFGSGCTVERAAAGDAAILTLRSPTGSFRRLRVAGGRVEAADGAEPARIVSEDTNRVEVAIGGDRYRIPREVLR